MTVTEAPKDTEEQADSGQADIQTAEKTPNYTTGKIKKTNGCGSELSVVCLTIICIICAAFFIMFYRRKFKTR